MKQSKANQIFAHSQLELLFIVSGSLHSRDDCTSSLMKNTPYYTCDFVGQENLRLKFHSEKIIHLSLFFVHTREHY